MDRNSVVNQCSITGGVTGGICGGLVSAMHLTTAEAIPLAILVGILAGTLISIMLRSFRLMNARHGHSHNDANSSRETAP